MRGKVIVAGASGGASTLRRLMDVGAAGVLIVGGIVEREVSACFGVPGRRIGCHRGVSDRPTPALATA